MARRLTDTYFAKYEFSTRLKNKLQPLSVKRASGIFVVPEKLSVQEFIETVIERQVKHHFGNDYEIAEFVIIEMTPL